MNRSLQCLTAGLLFLLPGLFAAQAPKRSVTLEVMNPRAEIPSPPMSPLSPRVKDLAGKRIGIYWIGKAGGDNFWDNVDLLLKEKYPTAKILRYEGVFDLGDKRAAEIAKEVDALLYGVGD
jgi:hypothetical protein